MIDVLRKHLSVRVLTLALSAQAGCVGGTSSADPAVVRGPLTARTGLAAAFGSDGRAYLIGGSPLDGGVTGLVEAVDVDAGRVTPAPPLPTPRTDLAVVASPSGATIYALGGFDATGAGVASVEALDVASQTWSELPALPATSGAWAAAMLADGPLVAIAGASPVEVTSYDGGGWSPLAMPTQPFAARGVQAAATPDGRVWLLWNDPSVLGLSVVASTPDGIAWDAGPAPYGRGRGFGLVQSGGKLFALGGAFCGVDFCDGSQSLAIFTPFSGAGWVSGPTLPAKRDGFGAAVGPDGRIYAFAGQTSDGLHATPAQPAPYAFTALETYDVYDPNAGRWEPTHE